MKRILICAASLFLLLGPQLALAADIEDLKAANAQLMKAFVSLDAAAIASMIHPGAVNFESVFPMVAPSENTEAQLTTLYKAVLSPVEYLQIVPYNMQHKVVGDTGIVWGHYTMYSKAKGEPAQTRHVRMSSTWVKSGGKWFVLLAHSSAIPSGE